MAISELNMMPIHLKFSFRNDHDMFEVQVHNQFMKTKERKTLTTTFDNKPDLTFREGNTFKKSHFEKILK
jgi:hypothetical protein